MKVAFLVGRFPVLSEAFIVNQITGLLARGHEVDIYALSGFSGETKVHPDVAKYKLLSRTTYAPSLPATFLARLISGCRLLVQWGWRDPVLFLRALNVFRYGKTAASLRFLHLVVPFLGGKSYDIIHCQFGTYGLLGVSLREMGAIAGALVTTFRGFDISEYPRRQGEGVYLRLFAQGDLFFANCDFFRQRVIALGGDADNIIVHRSSIDCDTFAFSPRRLAIAHRTAADQKITLRLATVGRLTEKKGLAYGIRAIAQLMENSQLAQTFDVHYDIIGEGALRADLQQLIQQLGLSHCVHLRGKKQQTEIIEILSRAHLFIAPCVTASSGDQDAPINTLKEAMAMGLPVVSTWHGGIPELVEDGVSGYLVPERDAEAIAHKLTELINHPETWPQMGAAGRAKVLADYELNQLNDELVMHYEQLLQRQQLSNGPPAPDYPVATSVR
ncbi:MAG: glycosyltransferase [Cyanobacteria bacterium J06597_16]